jgi:predicted methyltransferase
MCNRLRAMEPMGFIRAVPRFQVSTYLAIILITSMIALSAGEAGAQNTSADDASAKAALAKAVDSPTRSAEDKARDQYRHPVETLSYFGIKPDMAVVEIWPGGGWYTDILAPLLKDHGKLYEALPPGNNGENSDTYRKKLAADPAKYGKIILTELPSKQPIAPAGSADMVLTFRNVHNWVRRGSAEDTFKEMYAALKPGGILGVEEHRADTSQPQDPKAASGYVREDYVIKLADQAGFKLVSKSEINANPKDTKDYASGVWTLPPTLRLGDKDKDKYLAIGESDRMTLKFVKLIKIASH